MLQLSRENILCAWKLGQSFKIKTQKLTLFLWFAYYRFCILIVLLTLILNSHMPLILYLKWIKSWKLISVLWVFIVSPLWNFGKKKINSVLCISHLRINEAVFHFCPIFWLISVSHLLNCSFRWFFRLKFLMNFF